MRYVILSLSVWLSACGALRPAEAPSPEPAETVRCESIDFLRPQALKLNSAEAWKAAYRGVAAYHAADYSRAATQWRSVAAMESSPGAWFNTSLALARLGNVEHARKMLARIDPADVPQKLTADIGTLRRLLEPEDQSDSPTEAPTE